MEMKRSYSTVCFLQPDTASSTTSVHTSSRTTSPNRISPRLLSHQVRSNSSLLAIHVPNNQLFPSSMVSIHCRKAGQFPKRSLRTNWPLLSPAFLQINFELMLRYPLPWIWVSSHYQLEILTIFWITVLTTMHWYLEGRQKWLLRWPFSRANTHSRSQR